MSRKRLQTMGALYGVCGLLQVVAAVTFARPLSQVCLGERAGWVALIAYYPRRAPQAPKV